MHAHHLSGFGSVALVASLIFAEFKRSGTRVPLDASYVRTDIYYDNVALSLGDFEAEGLDCNFWWDADRGSDIGAFALGVELED
jgi:hypothetical protein